jgi:3-deoxy-manno-octulosonate cytidylyltransferase (CMP-KDO synthetase)
MALACEAKANLHPLAFYTIEFTSPIPFDRDGSHPQYYKHLGIYGHRKHALDKFVHWPESSLERSERLEQLRFLENGVPIYVAETPFDTIGVDTEEDVRRVEEILKRNL